MPIYEYNCKSCGHDFEALLRSRNETPPPCPTCGATKLAKQFSSFSAHMATSGGAPCAEIGKCPAGACPGSTCGPGSCPL